MASKYFKEFRSVRLYLINISLVVTLVITAIYLGIYIRNSRLLIDTVKDQADSYYDLIVTARKWNASYGGVYVEKKGNVESNAYLKQIGKDPDIKAEDGRVFTLRNPAMMTHEISDLAMKEGHVRFHLCSLKLINPSNAPDAFETSALRQFEKGKKELWTVDRTGREPVFRFMGPLYVEQACLKCHEQQGYSVGEVRGGISIEIPLGMYDQRMKKDKWVIIGLSLFTLSLVLSTMYMMTSQLARKLFSAQERIKEISITDELTGLRNRRFIMGRLHEEYQRAIRTGETLGVMMLDLDHFKNINDTFGHSFGDLVLKTVSARMTAHVREYDMVGRIGGEEFLVVYPGVSPDGLVGLAERIRDAIGSGSISDGKNDIAVTSSIGVTLMTAEDGSPDVLLARADSALYKAKESGRDRVVVM